MEKLNIPLLIRISLMGDRIPIPKRFHSETLSIFPFLNQGFLEITSENFLSIQSSIGIDNLQKIIKRDFNAIEIKSFTTDQEKRLNSNQSFSLPINKKHSFLDQAHHEIKEAAFLLNQYLNGHDSLFKNESFIARILNYKGLSTHKLVINHIFSPSPKSKLLLKSSGYDFSIVELPKQGLQAFYSNANSVIQDVYYQLPQALRASILSFFKDLNDKRILVSEAHDIQLIQSLSETDNSVFVLPSSQFNKKLIETACYQASVFELNGNVGVSEFDFGLSFIQKNDRINTYGEHYEHSYLREDEKHILHSLAALKENGQAIFIVPSELSDDKRSVFHEELLKNNSVLSIVRLPKNTLEKQESFDLFFIKRTPDLKTNLSFSERLVSINGKPLSQEKDEVLFKTSSEISFNNFVHYQIQSYKSNNFNLLKAVNFNFLSYKKEVLTKTNETRYKEDSFYVINEDIYQCHHGKLVHIKPGVSANRVKQFIQLYNALSNLYRSQKRQAGVKRAFEKLNDEYELFVSKFGFISLRKNERALSSDPRYTGLLVLEEVTKNKKTSEEIIKKSSVFTKPVFNGKSFYSDRQNVALTANQYFEINGRFNTEDIGKLVKMTSEEVEEYLIENQIVFKVGEELVHRDIYLTGNIGEKLSQAIELAKIDLNYQRNVSALKNVMPEKINFDDIYFSIGSHWMPKEIIEGFLNEEFKANNKSLIKIDQNPLNLTWAFDQKNESYLRLNNLFNARYSFGSKSGIDVLLTALNGLSTNINSNKSLDMVQTELYKQKVAQLQKDFISYVQAHFEYSLKIERIYNDLFNSYKKIEFNSVMNTLPGINQSIQLRPHQMNAIQMSVLGNMLYAHDAGSGKTFTQITSALLRSKNPNSTGNSLIVVPNHMPREMLREALNLFPEMKVLLIDSTLIKQPEKLLKKVKDYPWDAFIIKHNDLGKISVPLEFERKQLISEIEKLKSIVEYYAKNQKISKDFIVSLKKLEKKLEKIDERMATEGNRSLSINIKSLNIGTLIVDEAHNFKNLEIKSPTGNMVDTISGSNRAYELKNIVDYIYFKNRADTGVIFATGTPISNSLLEIFNLHQYLQPQLLKKLGLDHIKNWADTFLEIKTDYEPDVTGQNFVLRNRYVLKNIPELINILSTVMNTVTIADAGIKVPEHKMHYVNVEMDEKQKEVAMTLVERMEKIMKKQVKNKDDNKLKIISDGRKLALSADMVLSEDNIPKMSPKLDAVCKNIYFEYQNSHAISGTQLVFCDLGTPSGLPRGNSIYDLIKQALIQEGMKPNEIAFIHDAKKDTDKEKLFNNVRDGSVRVLIGSTAKMGEGTNVQDRLVASHDVDPPWRPKDVIQRRRRTIRQGNMNKLVNMYVYTTSNSFDGYVWATLDAKNKTFSHIMSGKITQRSFEMDIDPSFSETYALVTGNPLLIERAKIENQLITLNAKKNNLERQISNLKKAIKLNLNSVLENNEILKRLSTIHFKSCESEMKWSIEGLSSTRQEVLKNRFKLIRFRGMEVVFNDESKLWIMGGFNFKRPIDIEKQMNFNYEKRTDMLSKSNLLLNTEEKQLREALSKVNISCYDREIQELMDYIDDIEREISTVNKPTSSNNHPSFGYS